MRDYPFRQDGWLRVAGRSIFTQGECGDRPVEMFMSSDRNRQVNPSMGMRREVVQDHENKDLLCRSLQPDQQISRAALEKSPKEKTDEPK
jgi:hypothetical protein